MTIWVLLMILQVQGGTAVTFGDGAECEKTRLEMVANPDTIAISEKCSEIRMLDRRQKTEQG